MDHRNGQDPTPQGRIPGMPTSPEKAEPADVEGQKYQNSTPGPDLRGDGTYFFGYKRENAYPPERNREG